MSARLFLLILASVIALAGVTVAVIMLLPTAAQPWVAAGALVAALVLRLSLRRN